MIFDFPMNRATSMKNMLIGLAAALLPFSAVAAEPGPAAAEVQDAVRAFNGAYASNDVDKYFSYYADDASLYFYGARHTVLSYQAEWSEMIADGGAVEKNELSDIQVRVLPCGDAAVATYFIDYRLRAPDGGVAAANAFESDVWQKIDGTWKVVSLHYSEFSPAE